MKQPNSTLDEIFENWRIHNGKLCGAVASLTNAQLGLQPAKGMWPLGQILQHIVSVRAGWFAGTLQENDETMQAYMSWGQRESPERSATELVRGLEETMAFIELRLNKWTPEDFAKTFPDEWDGKVYQVSRNWVTYHVLEHDLHHGGEASLILGMHGLKTIDL
jgi:uncharacterized damage-inducible protein DinB